MGRELPGSNGWMLFAYTAAAGSPTRDRLVLLGSLAATRSDEASASSASA